MLACAFRRAVGVALTQSIPCALYPKHLSEDVVPTEEEAIQRILDMHPVPEGFTLAVLRDQDVDEAVTLLGKGYEHDEPMSEYLNVTKEDWMKIGARCAPYAILDRSPVIWHNRRLVAVMLVCDFAHPLLERVEDHEIPSLAPFLALVRAGRTSYQEKTEKDKFVVVGNVFYPCLFATLPGSRPRHHDLASILTGVSLDFAHYDGYKWAVTWVTGDSSYRMMQEHKFKEMTAFEYATWTYKGMKPFARAAERPRNTHFRFLEAVL